MNHPKQGVLMSLMVLMSGVILVGCLNQGDDGLPYVRKHGADIRLLSPVPSAVIDVADYLPKVLVRGVISTPVTYAPGAIPNDFARARAFVRGEFKNIGNRTLRVVGFTIDFLDASGRRVDQLPYRLEVEMPIRPHSTRPWWAVLVEPPSAWLAIQPPQWETGVAAVRVTNIEFAPSEHLDSLEWHFR